MPGKKKAVSGKTVVAEAVEEFYRYPAVSPQFLLSLGVVTVADLKRVNWIRLVKTYVDGSIDSHECHAVLRLVHWMASSKVSFADADPQQMFPTNIKDCGFDTRLHNALLRLIIHRLEMLQFFTAEEVREASRKSIGAGGLATLRNALTKRGLKFKGE